MHILIATDGDLDLLDEALAANSTTPWIVPKSAAVGDVCAFAHGGQGIVALGKVLSQPEHVSKGHWQGRYAATVGDIEALAEPVQFSELIAMFPDWKWPTYPRMYTTPPDTIAAVLLAALQDYVLERPIDVDAVLAFEGAPHIRRHLVRERDRSVVRAKIEEVQRASGSLECEVCGFDFHRAYGSLGKGFCEVHHVLPIGSRIGNEPTRLSDLAIVCSNCHRMLHRSADETITSLRKLVERSAV